MIKPAIASMILLASIARLSAEDFGGASGKSYRRDSPDGCHAVRAAQERGYFKFEVEIVDLASRRPVLAFDPKARFIGAAWSADSRFVAIEQNRGPHATAVSVFSMARGKAEAIGLPKECGDASAAALEAPTREHARNTTGQGFHFTSEGLQIVKWLSPDTLVLSASGMGWWGGIPAGAGDTRFLAEYEITLHFAADGRSSLRKTALRNYEELQAGRAGRR